MLAFSNLLVYKCPDDSQRVQHQAIYILLFPSRLMRPSTSTRWPDRVPGPTAPSLCGVSTHTCTVIHPPSLSSGCSRWTMMLVLQVTIFSTYAAITHGSRVGDQTGKCFPEWMKGLWGREEEQNLYKAPAGTESNPGGYYHIIWRAWFWGVLVPVGWVGPVQKTILLPSRDLCGTSDKWLLKWTRKGLVMQPGKLGTSQATKGFSQPLIQDWVDRCEGNTYTKQKAFSSAAYSICQCSQQQIFRLAETTHPVR